MNTSYKSVYSKKNMKQKNHNYKKNSLNIIQIQNKDKEGIIKS